VALALQTSTAWADDDDFDNAVTSDAFSPAAGTILLAFVANYDNYSATVSNSGTGLSWTLAFTAGTTGSPGIRVYWAYSASSQSNITVTFTGDSAFSYPSLKVYSVSGANTGSPIGASDAWIGLTGTTVTIPTGTVNSTVSSSWQFTLAQDVGQNGLMTSSNLTASATDTLNFALAGYKSLGASPEALSSSVTRPGSGGSINWITFELKPAGGSSLTAAAALSTTSTVSPTIAATRPAAAALSTTSAVTPAAALTRPLAAALSTTATLTATATRTAGAAAALSTAAAIAATMTVTPPVGTVTADAALSTAAALTSTAALNRPLDAALSTVATVTATAALSRPVAAAISTALSVSASMSIAGEEPTTVGYMRPAVAAAPSIRPRGGVTSPTIAALVSIDSATMTAVVDTAAARSPLGVPVFVGGSVSPVAAGLIVSGLAYVWFADDGIHVQGES
jgi:hypothetical protein